MIQKKTIDDSEIYLGDCIEVMKTLPDASVNCCVTSPPYWGLRNYNVDGQIGLEETMDEFLSVMVDVFREVRRVLTDDGTCWVNLGDSYAGSQGGHATKTTLGEGTTSARIKHERKCLPAKNLMGIPWRVAFALQDDGWYLRQDIIWSKPAPMPESARDRCTKSHEYLFLLTKNAKYYFDQEAILEPVSANTHARLSQDVMKQIGSERAHGGDKHNGNMKAVGRKKPPTGWANSDGYHDAHPGFSARGHKNMDERRGKPHSMHKARKGSGVGFGHGTDKEERGRGRIKDNESFDEALALMPEKRNKRSVWTINTQGFKEAHFATYPEKLVEPCVLAGCPKGGVVLDPFSGSGTTALVANKLGRRAIGIELNPEYRDISLRRISEATKQRDMFYHSEDEEEAVQMDIEEGVNV